MQMPPKAVLFDLDDTLAESFQAPSPRMIELLGILLDKVPVAIVTAAGWPRIDEQFLQPLTKSVSVDRLYIFPNSASEGFSHDNSTWKLEYDIKLSEDERSRIKQAIAEAVAEVDIRDARFEPLIIDREAQIAYAIVGLDAPLDVKKEWDPDQSKRKGLRDAIVKRVPDVDVRIGGTTTIDITKKDVNKSRGVEWLSKHLGIPAPEMLFIGDALYLGGNDEVVIPTGIQTRSTSGPSETEKIIEELLVI